MARLFQGLKVRLRRIYYRLVLRKCGRFLSVDDNVKFIWPSHLKVGNNVVLNKRVFLQCTPKSGIVLGDNVSMAYDSMILTAGNSMELDSKTHEYKDVIISDHVRILARALIVSGVSIGRGAIIGAGAVVRNDIPPYAIVAGNPAKIVGFLATPEEIISYEKNNYTEGERVDESVLENNYKKYFLSRLKEIKDITRL